MLPESVPKHPELTKRKNVLKDFAESVQVAAQYLEGLEEGRLSQPYKVLLEGRMLGWLWVLMGRCCGRSLHGLPAVSWRAASPRIASGASWPTIEHPLECRSCQKSTAMNLVSIGETNCISGWGPWIWHRSRPWVLSKRMGVLTLSTTCWGS